MSLCTRLNPVTMKPCGGELVRWRGTDGHCGWEWFTTCAVCGVTY